MALSQPHQRTAYHLGSRKWLPHQAWCRRYPLQSQVSHRWVMPCHYTCNRHSLSRPPVLGDATALLVDPQHALWAMDGVVVDTTTANSTGVLARFLENIMANTRNQEHGLLHVDMEPLTFHASLPRLGLGDIPPLGVCDEHQVINVGDLRRITWKGLHLTVLTIDLYRTPAIGIHALDDTHSAFLAPRLIEAHHRTFLGTRSKALSRSTKAK